MTVVDEYLKNVRPEFRTELEKIRELINTTVEGTEEVISNGTPPHTDIKGKTLYITPLSKII